MGPSSEARPWQVASSNSRLICYFGVAVEGGLMSNWLWAVISASPRPPAWCPAALEMPVSPGLPLRAKLDRTPAHSRQGLLSSCPRAHSTALLGRKG